MTDYKNELEQIFKKLNGSGAHACYCERSTDKGCECALKDEYLEEAIASIEALLSQHSKKRELEARLDEARYWDEHIMGSPRKVTANERAKDRINQLGGQK